MWSTRTSCNASSVSRTYFVRRRRRSPGTLAMRSFEVRWSAPIMPPRLTGVTHPRRHPAYDAVVPPRRTASRRARVEDVHQTALALPHVTVEASRGGPVYQVGGKSF